jgi:hypothetical protein
MNHAVVNDNHGVRKRSLSQDSTKLVSFQILQHYLSSPLLVPITLNHFKMLARLGRAPVCVYPCSRASLNSIPIRDQNYQLLRAIRDGAEFFLTDDDYLKYSDVDVKRETPSADAMPSETIRDPALSMSTVPTPSSSVTASTTRTRKRLHRSAAATVKSYALPDSDEESSTRGIFEASRHRARTHDSDLQLWIKHLSALQKDETKKVRTISR